MSGVSRHLLTFPRNGVAHLACHITSLKVFFCYLLHSKEMCVNEENLLPVQGLGFLLFFLDINHWKFTESYLLNINSVDISGHLKCFLSC